MIENSLTEIFEKVNRIEQILLTSYNQSKQQVFETEKPIPMAEMPAFTSLSKSYLYKLVNDNLIPFYKVGNKLYFDRAEIIEWLKRNKSQSKSEINQIANNYCLNNQRITNYEKRNK